MIKKVLLWRIRRAPLVIVACLSLFAGTAWARQHGLADARWLWLVLPPTVWMLRKQDVRAGALVALCCFGLGWWRGSTAARQLLPYQILRERQVVVVGRATSEGAYDAHKQLVFTMEHVAVVRPMRVSLPGSLTAGGFASAVYRGDVVQVSGKLYPTRGNNLAAISFADVQVLRHEPSVIDRLRLRFTAGLQSALPEPLASFGLGLLVGQRATLPANVAQQLLMVGLTHIIAVSGYNLTIMVEAARRLFGNRSKFQTAAACVLLILSFLLITGNSPSIIRASLISLLSLGAWYYGRTIQPLVLLLFAAALTVVANPMYLWGNVSWYLSFLAFFGVVLVAPVVLRRFYGEERPKLLVKMIIESLSAESLTLPYVLYIFGQMSTVGLLGNLLIAVCVPVAMLWCVIAGLSGMLLPTLAGWLAWPAVLLLTYMLDAAGLLSRVPHAFIEHIHFGLAALLVTYAVVALLVWVWRRRSQLERPPPQASP